MLTIFGSLSKTKNYEIFQHVDYHATNGMNVYHKKSHSIINIILKLYNSLFFYLLYNSSNVVVFDEF